MDIRDKLEKLNVHPEWEMDNYIHLATPALKKCFRVKKRNSVFCPNNDWHMVFRPFQKSPSYFDGVMIGQDPYPSNHYCTGLAFDIPEQCVKNKDFPLSYKVIEKAFVDQVLGKTEEVFSLDIQLWWNQGFLPLNAALTCEVGQPGSHTIAWRNFMREVLNQLARKNAHKEFVWLFMGKHAAIFSNIPKKNDLVIITNHPASSSNFNPRFDLIYSKIPYLDLPF